MNKNFAKKYPKWRRRCLECKHIGLNTPEGIYCKGPQRLDPNLPLLFIPADITKSIRCKQFEQYKNPFECKEQANDSVD